MKFKGILLVKLLLLSFITLSFIQCNESDEKLTTGGDIIITDSLPTGGTYSVEPTNLDVISGLRQLKVSWEAPANETPAFYLVEWQGITSDQTVYSQSVNETEITLTNLYNTEYKVTVRAVSDKFVKSQGITKTVTPIEDHEGPENISGLEISPLASTVNFTWTNPEDEDFDHIVLKIQEQGVDTFLYAENLVSIYEAKAFGLLKEGQAYSYFIQTFDYIGNASEILEGTFNTKFEQLLKKVDDNEKPLWEIADFSSQETRGDNGYAANAIDGKENTFWHSVWNGGDFHAGVSSGAVPQYITIDLKEDYTLSGVLLYRRSGNSGGPTSAKIELTSGDPLLGATQWIDLGTTKDLPGKTENGALSCVLNQVATGRYVRITILTVGSGNYAMLREVDIKALVDK